MTVYGYSSSGNCHKLRLMLTQLRREFRWVEIDSTSGGTRTPEYLAKNPNGKVPMIEADDGRIMTESNAILCWLAEDTAFWSGDAWQRAQALSWMFFEQYSHEPYIAVARFIRGWTPLDSPRRADLPKLRERGQLALAVMELHLQQHPWFSGGDYGVADIALFAYTDVADEGGFDLAPYPAIRDWLLRVRRTPNFIAMPLPPVEAASRIALPD
ncbi:glutathione S-transferase family protein [Lysobacter niastensis]|uniref:Glutathione S-transferase family protein n=1 Tax=Lysobacter niastensis TaxID=380629 RepID=A0ABS0B8Z2_9GAMM|nr:glutathione S-transferase family protein [Lysobacter niastensis]MBF6024708.1 glutathione S-transferase family protein [Lysobacter niastensis]